MGELRIGISGWTYKRWRGTFYPKGLAQRRELEFASRQMNSIEINGSFYSLQRPSSYQEWYSQTPNDFLFAVKGGRFITHMKKLNNVEKPLANFFASGLLCLREKLGPILWQFPPNLGCKIERFEKFLKMLPRNTREAAELARYHDGKLKAKGAYTRADVNIPLRYAFEIRHETFRCAEFYDLLKRSNAALVLADTAGRFPFIDELTADFAYVRLHGSTELYASGYTDDELNAWARRIRAWQKRGRSDVYVYFDNDAKVYAPFNAIDLAKRLGLANHRAEARLAS